MMETIPKSECEKIGYFKKTHGVNGDLILEFETEFEESIENANCFFVELDGLLVPFFINDEGFRFKNENTAIVSLEDVKTEKYAKRMIGQPVYLFKTDIEEQFDEPEEKFEGYLLIDNKTGELGRIEFIDNYSGNIVFTLKYNGRELLVPFNEDLLVEIDDEKEIIILNLPEGLID